MYKVEYGLRTDGRGFGGVGMDSWVG